MSRDTLYINLSKVNISYTMARLTNSSPESPASMRRRAASWISLVRFTWDMAMIYHMTSNTHPLLGVHGHLHEGHLGLLPGLALHLRRWLQHDVPGAPDHTWCWWMKVSGKRTQVA